jgi:hypothetical protein
MRDATLWTDSDVAELLALAPNVGALAVTDAAVVAISLAWLADRVRYVKAPIPPGDPNKHHGRDGLHGSAWASSHTSMHNLPAGNASPPAAKDTPPHIPPGDVVAPLIAN